MAIEVHAEPLQKRYYAAFCSSTCCYMIIYGFVIILLPLIIAYNSYDFWLKEAYILEQPDVSYKYQTIVQWHGINKQTDEILNFFYSTNPSINRLYSSALRLPYLRSAEFDDNRDGKTERLEISLELPLQDAEYIHGVTVAVYFDTKLHARAKYTFDAVGYVNYESGSPMSKLSIDGDLMLRQSQPFAVYGGYRNLYPDDFVLYDIQSSTSATDVAIENVMKKYNARNVTLRFHPNYEFVERRASYTTLVDGGDRSFNTSIVMRIPEQIIWYSPTTSAVLKFAWIQYMSFFIVIAFLLGVLNSFIFKHNLLPTFSKADIIYEKSH